MAEFIVLQRAKKGNAFKTFTRDRLEVCLTHTRDIIQMRTPDSLVVATEFRHNLKRSRFSAIGR